MRRIGKENWTEVDDGNVDPHIPYRYQHPDGSDRSLAVFFYDGHVAKAIAFDGVLASSHVLLDRIERAAGDGGPLVNIATDGESYGHHFKFGDRCLAYALDVEARGRGFEVTNYSAVLAAHEPEYEVEIKRGPEGEGTAWSCAHGLGRWTRDCSCHAGADEGWQQKWRTPLRAAFSLLRDEAARHFETLGGDLFIDPWAARDAYVELLSDGGTERNAFLARHAGRVLGEDERVRALTLLEMQRSALAMFTSCGWFFNDISGIETVQDLKYAGRVMDFLGELHVKRRAARFSKSLQKPRATYPCSATARTSIAGSWMARASPCRMSPPPSPLPAWLINRTSATRSRATPSRVQACSNSNTGGSRSPPRGSISKPSQRANGSLTPPPRCTSATWISTARSANSRTKRSSTPPPSGFGRTSARPACRRSCV